jgi:hypothetical protein
VNDKSTSKTHVTHAARGAKPNANLNAARANAAQPADIGFPRRARWLDVVPKDIRIQAARRLISETPAIVAGSTEADHAMMDLAVALLAGCGVNEDECIDALTEFMLSSGEYWADGDILHVVCHAKALAPLADPCDMATHLEHYAADVVQAIGVRVDAEGDEVVIRKTDASLRFLPARSDTSKSVQYEQALLRLLPDVPSNLLRAAGKMMAINPKMERGIRARRLTQLLTGPFRSMSSLFG